MKNLISLLALITCLSISCNSPRNEIGIVDGKSFVISSDLKDLRLQGENHLEKAGIKTKLVTFEILEDYVEGTQEIYYMLVAKNEDGSIKIATTLQLKDGTFQYDSELFADSCVCSGCAEGCLPRRHKDDGIIEWYCSPCTEGSGCTKSEGATN